MTPEQEQHLQKIKDSFLQAVDDKYRRGQEEHGGNLWEIKSIIKMLKEEAVDLWVYAVTLEQQLQDTKTELGSVER